MEALQESERRYRLLAENANDAIFWTALDGRFLYVSPAWERITGYAVSEFHANPRLMIDIIHPQDRKTYLQHLRDDEGTGTHDLDLRIRHRDGSLRWIGHRCQALYDDEGRYLGRTGVNRDITKRKQYSRELERFRNLVEQARDPIYLVDPSSGRFLDFNQAAYESLGATREWLLEKRVVDIEETIPDQAAWLASMAAVREAGSMTLQGRHCRVDGRCYAVEISVKYIHTPEQDYLIASARDISERLRSEERLRQAASVYQSSRDGIMITDPNGIITAVNPAVTEITGYSEQELLGQTPRLLHSGHHERMFYQQMWAAVEEYGDWSGEIWDRRKDGTIFPEWLTITAVHDDKGQLVNYTGVFSDLSQLRRSEEKLEYLTYHDPLTRLPNRALLNARLDHSIEQAQRHESHLALLLLDLDRFKDINDSLGLNAGDQLLQEVSRRVAGCVREEDTVARLGGDELVVLLEDITLASQAAEVAHKIQKAMREPHQMQGHEIFLTASIGISIYPQNGATAELLMRNADAAVYRAKQEGRDRFLFYSDEHSREALQRLSLEASLRRALERGEFELHYQPQVYLASGRLAGVEALIRWHHPERGMVPPVEFITLAENLGLIGDIGNWVLDVACQQMAVWRRNGVPVPRVAVNMSAQQLSDEGLVETVTAALRRHGLPTHALELELTETAIMRDPETATAILHALVERGIELAVDDFGTGYSSMAYLQQLHLHRLKIDRAFVQGLPGDKNNTAICRAVIAMASSLGLETIAEGIEEEPQSQFLSGAACHIGQGWLFGRPMPAAELEAWLAAAKP